MKGKLNNLSIILNCIYILFNLTIFGFSQEDFERNIFFKDTVRVEKYGYQFNISEEKGFPLQVISNDDINMDSQLSCYEMFSTFSNQQKQLSCEYFAICKHITYYLLANSNYDEWSLHRDINPYLSRNENCTVYQEDMLKRKSYHSREITVDFEYYSSKYSDDQNFAHWIKYETDDLVVNPSLLCAKKCSDINVNSGFSSCLAFNFYSFYAEGKNSRCYLLIANYSSESTSVFGEFNQFVRKKVKRDYESDSPRYEVRQTTSYVIDPTQTDFMEIIKQSLESENIKNVMISEKKLVDCGHECSETDDCDFFVSWRKNDYDKIIMCARISLTGVEQPETLEEFKKVLRKRQSSNYRIFAKKSFKNIEKYAPSGVWKRTYLYMYIVVTIGLLFLIICTLSIMCRAKSTRAFNNANW